MDKCKIAHQEKRWFTSKTKESFEHQWGDFIFKYVFENTNKYIDGDPIQRKVLNTYRKCSKCGDVQVDAGGFVGWWTVAPAIDVEWRDNGLN